MAQFPSTSAADGIWTLKKARRAILGDNWPELPPWAVDISNTSYDSVSFSVSSQEAQPSDVVFNNTGTKMYVIGLDSDTVFQYSLSTAFDVSTASYDSVSLSVAAQDTTSFSMFFNSDGTKMYTSGNVSDDIFQYTLSTAFDLSTASYASLNFQADSQVDIPEGLAFNSDGTKMFVGDRNSAVIYQYTLSTAENVSTASYDSVSFNLSSQEATLRAFAFNAVGTKLYAVGNTNDTVYQYTLSTGFDLSTASYDSINFSVASQSSVPLGIRFSADGSKMYIADYSTSTIYQYSTG
jgi:hypothetical protein